MRDEQEFYNIYQKYIGVKEFVFKNYKVQFDNEQKKVVFLQHKDVAQFVRVAGNYMKFTLKMIQTHNGKMVPMQDLVKYPVGEITREYGKDFLRDVQSYDGLTLKPCNTKKYEKTVKVEGFGYKSALLNMYEPLVWDEKEGELKYTFKYLKHIFGGNGTVSNNIHGDNFTMALDYLTLLYQQPAQLLPSLMLVSKEQETGKTSFGNFLTNIYGNNSVSLKINDFLNDFNMLHAFKLITIIDEGTLDLEKNHAKNVIKNLTTSPNVIATPKGIDSQLFPNFKKLLIFNNEELKPMKLTAEDNRFWVIKVPVLEKGEKDPKLLDKMRKEIPAFLHFLGSREVFHEEEGRFWFADDYIKGEKGRSQFWKIVDATRTSHEVEIENLIRGYFIEYKINELRIDVKHIIEGIAKTNKYKVSGTQIREFFKEREINPEETASRMRIPCGITENRELEYIKDKRGDLPFARHYKLFPQDWLSKKELEEHAKGFHAIVMNDYDPSENSFIIDEKNLTVNFHMFLSGIKDSAEFNIESLINTFNEKHRTTLLTKEKCKEALKSYVALAKEYQFKGHYHWHVEANEAYSIVQLKIPLK